MPLEQIQELLLHLRRGDIIRIEVVPLGLLLDLLALVQLVVTTAKFAHDVLEGANVRFVASATLGCLRGVLVFLFGMESKVISLTYAVHLLREICYASLTQFADGVRGSVGYLNHLQMCDLLSSFAQERVQEVGTYKFRVSVKLLPCHICLLTPKSSSDQRRGPSIGSIDRHYQAILI